MRSVNKVILMGNLAADAESHKTKSGITLTTFPLATSNEWPDKDGVWQKSTDFHRVVAWRRVGENCKKLTKGSAIYVEGQIHNRSYEVEGKNKSKEKKYVNEITVDKVNFIKIKKTDGEEKVELEETA